MTTTPAGLRVVALIGSDPAATAALVGALVRRTGSPPVPAGEPGLVAVAVDADGVRLRLLHPRGTPAPEAAVSAALRAADAALLVLPAVGGPDARTVQRWEDAGTRGLARLVAVTGLDAPLADADEAVALAQRLLGDDVLALQLPMLGDDDTAAGVLDLLRLRVHDWSTGARVERDPDPEHVRMVEGLRSDLVEAVLADSDDETLLDRYLDGEVLGPAVLQQAFASAVGGGRLHPVVVVQDPVGTALLHELLGGLPGPAEVEQPRAARPDGAPVAPLTADPAGPLAAEVLGPAGDGWLVRVRSGTLRVGAPVRLAGHGRAERDGVVGALTGTASDACPAGELCTVSDLPGAGTADTLSAPDDPLLLAPWGLPEPLHPVALRASDAALLVIALERLALADPVVRVEPGLVWCLDEQHGALVLDRLRGEGLDVHAAPADLGDGPDLHLLLEVPTAVLRPVLRALARHDASGVDAQDDEERDVVLVSADVPRPGVAGLAAALSAASRGTARRRSR